MRTPLEDKLLDALLELEETATSGAGAAEHRNLLPLFARVDTMAGRLPRGTNPVLLHYLGKKSYQKARLFLQGRDPENQRGACGRKS
ncbi:MAG: hypothetical protein KGR98_00960 [Verrucomicrobia bacterium]|nr:hypothetical protein [Verrucomicrobiota bacterium]MDE3098801.1 hypothetical protein [Verrucomicrobiota bacterium]